MNDWKIWRILKPLLIFAIIGAIIVIVLVFKKEALKILGIYVWVYIRPEVFMLLAYTSGQNVVVIFFQVFAFTTFTTLITWYLTDVAQKTIVKSSREGHLAFLKKYCFVQNILAKTKRFKNWFDASKEKYERKSKKFLNWFLRKSRYALFVPFTLPVFPGMDTTCVVLAKVIKLPYALLIFLGINAVKIIIILLLCVYAPNVYHWLLD